MKKKNIAVFTSHNGSNLQALIDASKDNRLFARIVLVVSNNSDSGAIKRANNNKISYLIIDNKGISGNKLRDKTLLDSLLIHNIDLIILAGFVKKLGSEIIKVFENRIINTHPALLPKYGGKGMYGDNVYKAILEAGEEETGVSVHIVNEEYDQGPVVAQTKLPVHKEDTIENLRERVKKREREFLVETVSEICKGNIKLDK
ncbi:MAG: phosphoribosylglycinamide formyltransferase [Actinomycetia bacterium]|nr:phosphoribosylglycinamide formyltransferase [Actinomycetes bacterium]